MTSDFLFAATGAVLFVLAAVAFFNVRHLLRKLLALNIAGSGVFLAIVGLAQRLPGQPPDPVAQALVLTGIVVAIAATALAVVLLGHHVDATGHDGADRERHR